MTLRNSTIVLRRRTLRYATYKKFLDVFLVAVRGIFRANFTKNTEVRHKRFYFLRSRTLTMLFNIFIFYSFAEKLLDIKTPCHLTYNILPHTSKYRRRCTNGTLFIFYSNVKMAQEPRNAKFELGGINFIADFT